MARPKRSTNKANLTGIVVIHEGVPYRFNGLVDMITHFATLLPTHNYRAGGALAVNDASTFDLANVGDAPVKRRAGRPRKNGTAHAAQA